MKRMITQELIEQLSQIIENGGFEWVSQMKELLTYNEELQAFEVNSSITGKETNSIIFDFINDEIWLDNLSILVNMDEDPFFPGLTDQAGKAVVVNEDETGFTYQIVPHVWTTDSAFEDLSSGILEQLQVGDIIYSSFEEGTAQVDEVETDYVYLKTYNISSVSEYEYIKEDDEWSCTKFEKIYGTKLYKHTIDINQGDTLVLITNSDVVLNTMSDVATAFLTCVNASYQSGQDGYGTILSISSTEIVYYDNDLSQITTIQNPSITYHDVVEPM